MNQGQLNENMEYISAYKTLLTFSFIVSPPQGTVTTEHIFLTSPDPKYTIIKTYLNEPFFVMKFVN